MNISEIKVWDTVYVDYMGKWLSGQIAEIVSDETVLLTGFAHFGMTPISMSVDKLFSSPEATDGTSMKIEYQENACHYCGEPATSTGFFGEHVCGQCGG